MFMALKTKGSQWLKDYKEKAWAKLVLNREHIDLSRTGGYAITGPFIDFDKSVMLEPHQFLVVGSKYPQAKSNAEFEDGFEWVYRFALITCQRQAGEYALVNIAEEAMQLAAYKAIEQKVIPPYQLHKALSNWLHAAAVYMWMNMDPEVKSIMPPELERKVNERASGKLRRRIEYLDATPPEAPLERPGRPPEFDEF